MAYDRDRQYRQSGGSATGSRNNKQTNNASAAQSNKQTTNSCSNDPTNLSSSASMGKQMNSSSTGKNSTGSLAHNRGQASSTIEQMPSNRVQAASLPRATGARPRAGSCGAGGPAGVQQRQQEQHLRQQQRHHEVQVRAHKSETPVREQSCEQLTSSSKEADLDQDNMSKSYQEVYRDPQETQNREESQDAQASNRQRKASNKCKQIIAKEPEVDSLGDDASEEEIEEEEEEESNIYDDPIDLKLRQMMVCDDVYSIVSKKPTMEESATKTEEKKKNEPSLIQAQVSVQVQDLEEESLSNAIYASINKAAKKNREVNMESVTSTMI